jgi:hypothetical protein
MAEYTVLEKEVEYIPTWDNNREKDEPITFTLRYITDAERTRCQKPMFDERGTPSVEVDYESFIKYGVSKIANFSVGGKAITTAKEFLKLSGFYNLLMEIAIEIFTMNARQDSKNSE